VEKYIEDPCQEKGETSGRDEKGCGETEDQGEAKGDQGDTQA